MPGRLPACPRPQALSRDRRSVDRVEDIAPGALRVGEGRPAPRMITYGGAGRSRAASGEFCSRSSQLGSGRSCRTRSARAGKDEVRSRADGGAASVRQRVPETNRIAPRPVAPGQLCNCFGSSRVISRRSPCGAMIGPRTVTRAATPRDVRLVITATTAVFQSALARRRRRSARTHRHAATSTNAGSRP